MTEGIPLGFTATALVTQMRRQGVSQEAIGLFVGTLYLPWAWKWAMGPVVDLIASDRWGRRRGWILLTQVLMAATLLAGTLIDFAAQLPLFTALILLHNACSATQDVAIDALACSVLPQEERGLANGLMFAGASLGQAVGGSGVLFLVPHVGFPATFVFVTACLLAVTVFIALPLREGSTATLADSGRDAPRENPWSQVIRELTAYIRKTVASVLGHRASFLGVLFAALPAGSYALGLALQTNLAVELGLADEQIAWLNLFSTVVFAVGCVSGGFVSDRWGRRLLLALYTLATAVPAAWLGVTMLEHGWILPIDPRLPDRPVPAASLVTVFWTAVVAYNVISGLSYGTRMALFMDITTPEVAATQFTAYMALQNLAISYSSTWQGWSISHWGYPRTLFLDAGIGLVGLLLLPWLKPMQRLSTDETAPSSPAVPVPAAS
jgi:PAT family beta-lactamase induction signal transducer AmpG